VKVLIATVAAQGCRESDFCFTVPGELVTVPVQCARDDDDVDGGCGCRRAMTGLATSRGTTTVSVAEMDFSPDDYAEAIRDAMERAGWGDDLEAADNMAMLLADVAAAHPVGTVLERRGSLTFLPRTTAA